MEDSKIIDLFWARDETAIQQIDSQYGKKLHTLAFRILNNREDAEESVSDSYLKAWEIIPPQRPTYLYAFLASICRNLSLHKVVWNHAEKRNAQIVALSEEMEQCIPDARREWELEDREIGQLLDRFLERLPRESRLIFLRRYWHGDSISEITARYHLSESKVKMQLSRTRSKLRKFLIQEGIQV